MAAAPPLLRRAAAVVALLVGSGLMSRTHAGGYGNGKINGLNFLNGQWSGQAKYDTPAAITSLDAMTNQTGASWVALTFCWYQHSVDAPGPITALDGTSPTDAALLEITAAARARGLSVLWRPCVDPRPMKDTWRGDIGRYFSEREWSTWFDAYTPFIEHYAILAEQAQIEQFSVGMELIQVSRQESHMRALCEKVRGRYTGSLTYAANHGNEHNVEWWDAVDVIGIDAYYTLAPDVPASATPTVAQAKASWQTIVGGLAALANKTGKKIAFDEVGYCSAPGNHLSPAGDGCQGTAGVSLPEQSVLVQALLEEVYPQPWFAGMFWWAWTTAPQQDDSFGFTVDGKPAAALLKKAFTTPVPDPPPPPPCVDVAPSNSYSCAQQKSWGKCTEPFMQGYCCRTCWACALGCGA
jgi:hypothetical protein